MERKFKELLSTTLPKVERSHSKQLKAKCIRASEVT